MIEDRFTAYFMLQEYQNAMADAEKMIALNTTHWKGYYRKA